MRLTRMLPALLAFSLLICSTAAAKTYAPPGKAGSSQYSETIPSSGGNVATPTANGGHPSDAIAKLGSGRIGIRKLAKLGDQGASAAHFAQVTAPTPAPGGALPSARPQQLASSGGSALSAVADVIGGSDTGGIGILLPLLLAFGLGAAVALSLARARRGRRPPA